MAEGARKASAAERISEPTWTIDRPAANDTFRIAVASRASVEQSAPWSVAFARQRKDSRFFEIVEDTMHPEIVHRYLIICDGNDRIRAIQPVFLTDLDLTEGLSGLSKFLVGAIRRLSPSWLRARVLMLGCVAGEGHLDGDLDSQQRYLPTMLAVLRREAQRRGASLVVFKEFPASYRSILDPLLAEGFTRLPSLPMTRLALDFESFEEYMVRRLSRATRKNLRRKLRAAEAIAPIEMSVQANIEEVVDEVYPLYLQTYERSRMHFEKLTRDFLIALGRSMPDKVRFFIWRQNGRAVAFSVCMLDGSTLYDEYIGLDYQSPASPYLYHYSFRDIITWAIENGFGTYVSAGLCYDAKRHLRQDLVPLDLYVRHRSPMLNPVIKHMLRLLGPVRYDRALGKFPNYPQLW